MNPIVSTISKLPYNDLQNWSLFERLCRDLLYAEYEGLVNVREYLSSGHGQQGIDIKGYASKKRKHVYVQCKKYESFNHSLFKKAVETFKKGTFFQECDTFILAVSRAKVDEKYEKELDRYELEFSNAGKKFVVWDDRALNMILKKYPQIVFDIFDGGRDPNFVKAFNGDAYVAGLTFRPLLIEYHKPEGYIPRFLRYKPKRSDSYIHETLSNIIENNNGSLLIKSYATIGKTTELKYLAYFYSKEVKNVYFPVYISLKSYTGRSIVELLESRFSEEWNKLLPSNVLILLDGFDEIRVDDREFFLRKIVEFKDSYPERRLIVSARTNFVTTSSFFTSFLECELYEFHKNEIQAFISQKLDDQQRIFFNEYVQKNKIQNWVSSPYYLTKIIDLILMGTDPLPTSRIELINFIIEQANQKDYDRYFADTKFKIGLRSVLEKLALAYNLFGANSVTELELYDVFSPDEIELIKKSSLIDYLSDSVTFHHNILQEYLAATLLSQKDANIIKEAITFKPEHTKIKPKWFNTISLLIDVLKSQLPKVNSLVVLICREEDTILENIEYTFLHSSLRLQLFGEIISNHDRIYKRSIHEAKVAEICGLNDNEEVLECLLKSTIEQSDKYQLNELLRYFTFIDLNASFLSIYLSDIERIIFKTIKSNINNDSTCDLCFRILSHLSIQSEEAISLALKLLAKDFDINRSESILDYLNTCPNFEQFIDLYLEQAYKYNAYNEQNDHQTIINISSSQNLIVGLLRFNQSVCLHKILEHLISNSEAVIKSNSVFMQNKYNGDSFFKSFSQNLEQGYQEDTSLFEDVLDFFVISKPHRHEKEVMELVTFFFNTNTNQKAFWILWNKREGKEMPHRDTSAYFIDEEILTILKSKYLTGEIGDDTIWNVIRELSWIQRRELSKSFQEVMNQLSNNKFVYSEQPDFERQRVKKLQNDIELLLNKKNFIRNVQSVFGKKDKISIDDVSNYEDARELVYERSNHIIYSYLYSFFSNKRTDKNELISRDRVLLYIKSSESWEYYKVTELVSIPVEHQTSDSIKAIQDWCDKNSTNLNFTKAVIDGDENNFTVNNMHYLYGQAFFMIGIDVPKSVQLNMLSFDFEGNYKAVGKEEEITTITEKIISLQGEDIVKQTLLENVKENILSRTVIQNHISWCRKLKIEAAAPYIRNIFESRFNEDKSYLHSISFDTFIEFGGDVKELGFVFNKFDSSIDIHWSVIEEMAKQGVFRSKINSLIESCLSKLQDDLYLRACEILITNGSTIGLIKFVEWYKKLENVGGFEYVKSFKNLNFNTYFPILLNLLEWVLNKNLENTRFYNPITEIIVRLKIHGFETEANFKKCITALSELEQIPEISSNNLYSLKSGRFDFEKEYYLQKKEFDKFIEVKPLVEYLL